MYLKKTLMYWFNGFQVTKTISPVKYVKKHFKMYHTIPTVFSYAVWLYLHLPCRESPDLALSPG